MISFLAAVGIIALACIVAWTAMVIIEMHTEVNKHDSRIDDLAVCLKEHSRRLEQLDKDSISAHQSILRLDLALKEIDEKDIADLKAAGR